MKSTHPLLARFLPYLIIAFMLMMFVAAIFIFSYIFIFALIIGFILFAIGFIRAKFFGHTKPHTVHEEFFILDIKREQKNKSSENSGRIIEHNEETQ
jgi:polyferredoxin